MKRRTIFFVIQFICCITFSQAQNKLWQGYFSYNNIKDVSESVERVFAGTENAYFYQNVFSNDVKTFNSVDGLKVQTVSAIFHSSTTNLTFIGNENGLLLIVKADGTILQKRGILEEVPVSPMQKRINHFYEYDNKVYISTNYGISVFKLSTLEFGDSFFIGNGGVYDKVYQTTVYNNEIYAVTQSFGIKKAITTNPFLVDFNQWSTFDSGTFNGIVTFQNQIVASGTNNIIYKHNGVSFVPIFTMPQSIFDIRVNEDALIITTQNHTYAYNTSFSEIVHFQSGQITTDVVTFTCATIINNQLYIGTNEKGIVSVPVSNSSTYEFVLPDGPIKNEVFRLKKAPSKLWATYGKYDFTYTPDYANLGLSYYTPQNGWELIEKTQVFNALSLNHIAFNPANEDEVYVGSYHNGLVKISNNGNQLYNEATAPPHSPQVQQWAANFYQIRINGLVFDKNNNLWMANALVDRALKVLKANGQWQSYDLSNAIEDPQYERYANLVIDKNGTKWLPSYRANGLIAFNENYNNKVIKIKTGTEGNLPSNGVNCVAIDNKNQVWIGTPRGLRTISSVDSFLTEETLQSKSIIIEEDGLGQELFYEQVIIDIAVDGANRKWVALDDAGVYLISPNGQQTIYHFTTDNSPLPSNSINDIEIDGVTGEVFFATKKGLVSFKGTSTKPSETLENAYVYPNPVRPEFTGTVKVSGLTDKANVKITDIEGNLVYETTSEGGTIEWDTTAFGKYKVASGVYMIFLAAEDGIETKVKKVMIIR